MQKDNNSKSGGMTLGSFDAAYEEIKNYAAKTTPASIIKRSIKLLNEIYHRDIKETPRYVPWIPLALIEWALVYGPQQGIILRTEITDQGYNRLYNLLHNSGAGYETLFLKSGQPYGVIKFMRCMAHQQFWFQGGKNQLCRYIGRNLLLMKDFEKDFLQLTGLHLEDFFEILLTVFCCFNQEEKTNSLQKDFFNSLKNKYQDNQIDYFFSLLSLSLNELQNAMRAHYKEHIKKYGQQTLLTQITPLWRFPFIKENQTYICVYPALIEYAMKHFIYDYLKLNMKGKFSRPFGTTMEGHIKRGLQLLTTDFLDERQIQEVTRKERTKKQGALKSVDFILPQEDGLLFIESKAQEAPIEVRANSTNEVLEKHFQPEDRHVFHGIVQAYELYDFLVKTKNDILNSQSDLFLIIVTYKDFFLGRGADFWPEFVKNIVTPSLEKKNISDALIKPENIFIISLDDYDLLINQARASNVSILKILKYAIEQDKNVDTQKMLLSGHINSYNLTTEFNLPYINESFDKITSNIRNALQET